MMNVVDYLSIVLIVMLGLFFWYSVAVIGLRLWNRQRQDSDRALRKARGTAAAKRLRPNHDTFSA